MLKYDWFIEAAMSAIMILTHYIKAQLKGNIFRTCVALDAGWKALTFLKQKRRTWNHVAVPFTPPTSCNYIRKTHQNGKEKEIFSLLPFSIFLAGLLWLGGGDFEWQWVCIIIIGVSFLAVLGSVVTDKCSYCRLINPEVQNTLNY